MSVKRDTYAALLKAVARRPRAVSAVAAAAGCSPRVGRVLMARMHTLGLVHIAGWCEATKGPAAAMWLLGADDDAPPPLCRNGKQMPERIKRPLRPSIVGVEAIHMAALIKALREPNSVASLQAITGRRAGTLYASLRVLRAAGLVYISGWSREREKGDWAPQWQFGLDKTDAPRPRAFTIQELRKRYRDGRKRRDATLRVVRALAANASIFTRAA